MSPNGETKNEIDFLLTDKQQAITDITGLNSFNARWGYWLVRASLTINTKLEGTLPHEGRRQIRRSPQSQCNLSWTRPSINQSINQTNSSHHHESSSKDRRKRQTTKTRQAHPRNSSGEGKAMTDEKSRDTRAEHWVCRYLQCNKTADVGWHQQLPRATTA